MAESVRREREAGKIFALFFAPMAMEMVLAAQTQPRQSGTDTT